jgi:hypothetical protein
MNGQVVCFEGRGNRFGSIYNYVRSGLVAAIKLEHVSGHIRCSNIKAQDSNWGCAQHSGLKSNSLNAVVTDQHNRVIFPKKRFIRYIDRAISHANKEG